MVGDPSGKTEMRQMLTPRDDRRQPPRHRAAAPRTSTRRRHDALVVDNADWLLQLNYIDFLRDIGRHFSVNRMISGRGLQACAWRRGLSFIEFNYQLLQAYDFLVLHRRHDCPLQIGGDDQWGNIVAGVDLIRRVDQAQRLRAHLPAAHHRRAARRWARPPRAPCGSTPQRTSPYDFYQYCVNVDDRDVVRFLKLFTLPAAGRDRALRERRRAPSCARPSALLAHGVTAIVHGAAAADEADARRRRGLRRRRRRVVPTRRSPSRASIKIVDVLAAAGLAASKSAARRLVEQGGVRLGDRKIATVDDTLRPRRDRRGRAAARGEEEPPAARPQVRVAAIGLCLLAGCGRSGVEPGSFCASAEHVQAAFINVSRSTNSPAVIVIVFCDGSAEPVLESSTNVGPASKTFPANSPEVLKFLDNLDAVGDVFGHPGEPVGPGAQSRCTPGGLRLSGRSRPSPPAARRAATWSASSTRPPPSKRSRPTARHWRDRSQSVARSSWSRRVR